MNKNEIILSELKKVLKENTNGSKKIKLSEFTEVVKQVIKNINEQVQPRYSLVPVVGYGVDINPDMAKHKAERKAQAIAQAEADKIQALQPNYEIVLDKILSPEIKKDLNGNNTFKASFYFSGVKTLPEPNI